MLYLPFDGKNSPSIPFTLNRASPQAAGLVGWWPTVQASGGFAREYTSNFHATAAGAGTTVPSVTFDPVVGPMLSYDGSDDYLEALGSTKIRVPDALTLAAWVQPTDFANYAMICTKNPVNGDSSNLAGDWEWRTDPGTGQVIFLHQTGARAFSSYSGPTLSSGTLYHLAVTLVEGGNVVFYVNGLATTTTAQSGAFGVGNDNTVLIGRRRDGNYFKGLIGDLRIYNRALSAAEIWSLYAPQTRWDLYRVTPFAGAPSIAATVVSGAIRMPLLGVG